MQFSQESFNEFEKIVAKYPQKNAAMLPVLYLAQKEFGYISRDVMEYVAEIMDVPVARVLGVVTFYTMFNMKPVGRHHLQICMTLSCSLMGSDRLFRHLEHKLGIGHGETTADGRFTLRRVECLAACGGGPCMQVNLDYYENLDEAKVDALLEKLE